MAHLQAVRTTLQPQQNDYSQLTTYYDEHNQVAWGYMNAAPRPCFTGTLLREIVDWFGDVARRVDDPECPDVNYVVVASGHSGIYNLGGDLNLFRQLIEARDRENLYKYAQACIRPLFLNALHLNRPSLKTITLVQGDALGGGFECALSGNVLIAERGTKMGFPEILFNLFPGMGAMTLLGRKIGYTRAEKVILSGKLYTAEEMYELGAVDVLVDPGSGEQAVYDFIRKEARQRNGALALRAARELSQPIAHDELMRIAEIWVDAALRLESKDLRMMERLVARQTGKVDAENTGDSVVISA
ncbi:MAG: enoyl-CoA hydratase [Thiobacillus sp. 63-78]|uniref:crotonase/enoyl-CoA hydratase family protein n=1 Tax=Thiobacillus sp. 63-78 TaxID=1895859 RepID=UPI00095BEC8F|nr:crotonase/enoyl-CoA hydratase family protein [Thiobacillus sp. 63-78]MBN8762771.1 crotonase/enoyl-CoA hydratase family protein [Thiobacillus sp.]MBN8773317.1 crotonase/enoyl-CoA hydratase family protein [Thiobacillus sp.]OJZ04263.1 MAG: enoyl-CoA hydratase [Thiobacillus sp. 63-78]